MKKAIFLDRDGTIVEDLDFLTDLADLRLLPHASSAIEKFNKAGYLVVVVTNQSGVARGFLTEKTLLEIHRKLSSMLCEQGARIDAYYYCPHHPTVGPPTYRMDCACRKPNPGLFLRAAKELNLDLSQCFAIGDSLRDGEAARAAGIKAILVKTGPNRGEAAENATLYVRIVEDLNTAAQVIGDTPK